MYEEINQIHPTIKFTMVHTTNDLEPEEDRCDCPSRKSIPFLDTSLCLEKGKIEIEKNRSKPIFASLLLSSKDYNTVDPLFIGIKNSEDLH